MQSFITTLGEPSQELFLVERTLHKSFDEPFSYYSALAGEDEDLLSDGEDCDQTIIDNCDTQSTGDAGSASLYNREGEKTTNIPIQQLNNAENHNLEYTRSKQC